MQYTIRDIPKELDRALRRKAKTEGKSLNQAAVEALEQGVGLNKAPIEHHDLDWFAGTWVDDPAVEAALREQDQVHPDDWK